MKRVLLMALTTAFVFPAGAYAGAVNLRIEADTGRGTEVRRATLTCDGDGSRATGFLERRDAGRLCRRAYALERFLARAPDGDRACTEVYGGPSRARVRGNVRGRAVNRRFHRSDGCGIADWDRARPLLPRPASPTTLRSATRGWCSKERRPHPTSVACTTAC